MITSEQIKRRLWDGANELRGSMDASRYKDYMLGLMFYKFLSDKTLDIFHKMILNNDKNLNEKEIIHKYKKMYDTEKEELIQFFKDHLHYYVQPQYLYQTWLEAINNGEFEVQLVADSLQNFEKTIAIEQDSDDFKGLFSSSTIDLTNTALGSNLHERNQNIQALIGLFEDLNMVTLQKGDVLGDAYEYLIGQFAMESGAKAGEFYTPRQVSEVMAQIVAKTDDIKSIYDATVGSGSLLLTVSKHLDSDTQKLLHYYGQEKNSATYNLSRMNLLLHGVRPDQMTIKNGDTLGEDWPDDPNKPGRGQQFDSVVMNPPYSLKNWNRQGLKVNDPRFEIAGVLPPNSKGDYAFLLHGFHHLSQDGTMAIVLPHGVLFRGGTEGVIRQRLLEKNNIDTIIGLPASLFTNTGIPVIVMILKKNRPLAEPILFIDASEEFVKQGKQNVLLEKDIAKIVDTYSQRVEEIGYSHLASRKEIVENEFNLNIPRYVEKIDREIPHDVDAHLFGGIPSHNIELLKTLNNDYRNILSTSLKPIREGYVVVDKSFEEIKNEIIESTFYQNRVDEINNKIELYLNKYWERLKNVERIEVVKDLKFQMLEDIKSLLSDIKIDDPYHGYQIIADKWENYLLEDVEAIAVKDFYTVSKERKPNMVTKGTGKNRRQEQDGWVGTIIPNELISEKLFNSELNEIGQLKNKFQDIENELSTLVEEAKTEGTEENEVLYDALNKNKEDEPTNSFGITKVRSELSLYEKDSEEYKLLKNLESLMTSRTQLNRVIREKENTLEELVSNKIKNLTNKEVDLLVYTKWFFDIKESIHQLLLKPINEELDILRELHERYEDTLDDIDQEILHHENELNELIKQLVVVQ